MKNIYKKDLIFKIAAAASITDCKVCEDGGKKYVKMPELNCEYKYAQTVEWDPKDKERAVICSKDLKVWEVCIGVEMLTGEYVSNVEFMKVDAEVRMVHYGKEDTPEDIREKRRKKREFEIALNDYSPEELEELKKFWERADAFNDANPPRYKEKKKEQPIIFLFNDDGLSEEET